MQDILIENNISSTSSEHLLSINIDEGNETNENNKKNIHNKGRQNHGVDLKSIVAWKEERMIKSVFCKETNVKGE